MKGAKTWMIQLLPALMVIAVDQMTKLAVLRALPPYDAIPVIPGFLNLVHVRNPGIAFGLLSQLGEAWSGLILSVCTTAAVILLVAWFARLKDNDRRTAFGLSLVIGGAIGNLIDRVRLKEVVDFLDFYVGSFHWPAFNVADSAVTVGAVWLALSILFEPSSGE
jgi:signal peptidase II